RLRTCQADLRCGGCSEIASGGLASDDKNRQSQYQAEREADRQRLHTKPGQIAPDMIVDGDSSVRVKLVHALLPFKVRPDRRTVHRKRFGGRGRQTKREGKKKKRAKPGHPRGGPVPNHPPGYIKPPCPAASPSSRMSPPFAPTTRTR